VPDDRYLLVLSGADPVSSGVAARLPIGEPTGLHVEGAPIRRLPGGVLTLHRPGWPVQDEFLDRRLPSRGAAPPLPLVFPSQHRSERGVRCFTVHPLGNFGPAEIGGSPERLNPSAPRWMASALRQLDEAGEPVGLAATFEATHHGPALDSPSMFVEIGFGDDPGPPGAAVEALAAVLPRLEEDPLDRVAVGIGGGHYAPHFTDLARKRHWAFGHIVPRHVLAVGRTDLLEAARAATPEAEGFLFHRASDAETGPGRALSPRLRDNEAPLRGRA
jgi:D-aminoacyl-tRNA deacylase